MVAGLDRDEDRDAEPDAVLINQRHALLNDAVGFQPLNAFQQGVEDSPTREPISATDSEASFCRTVSILRSMASMRREPQTRAKARRSNIFQFIQ